MFLMVVGRLDEAIETAEKAMSLAEALNKQQLSKEIQAHLKLFKGGRAYYEISSEQDNSSP